MTPSVGTNGGAPAGISNEDLRAFYESTPEMMCVVGFDGYFKHVNRAWEKVLGHPASKMIGRSWLSFAHPDDRERAAEEAARTAEGAATVQVAVRFRSADGSYRWVSWTASSNPAAEVVYCVARDVTEHRRRETRLQASEQRFRTLIDSAPSGILIADGEGVIAHANRVVEEMFGYPRRGLDGMSVEVLIPDGARERHAGHVLDFMEEPRQRIMGAGRVLPGRHCDGHVFPVSIGLAPLPGESGPLVAATLTDMTESRRVEDELTRANAELEARIADLQELGREAELISEMGEMLQVSQGSEEAHRAIQLHASRLFPCGVGAVGLVNESRNLVENAVAWGGDSIGEAVYHPGDCWALRRGKPHAVGEESTRIVCSHLAQDDPERSLCVPLLAQGEALGVLILSGNDDGGPAPNWERMRRLSATFADHLALALANLRLRNTLQVQSIRDPLTGLFNRRYLEESLEREIARATRRHSPLGVIMLDLDHFKAFNDTHGHRAGDNALSALGELLRTIVRAEDVPCRYGGEEFALILPDAALDDVTRRADEVREALATVNLHHAGKELGRITLSAGVAVYPDHGPNSEALVQAADAALYRAKNEGRNRIAVAGD